MNYQGHTTTPTTKHRDLNGRQIYQHMLVSLRSHNGPMRFVVKAFGLTFGVAHVGVVPECDERGGLSWVCADECEVVGGTRSARVLRAMSGSTPSPARCA